MERKDKVSVKNVIIGVCLALVVLCAGGGYIKSVMADSITPSESSSTATAVVAGGCFWCVESDFEKMPGVVSTLSGYTGGTIENPTYQNYHDTGRGIVPHIEAVKVIYDPTKTGYEDLLRYFVRHIDPLDGGGQFCDRGPAYRPVVFVQNEKEGAAAKAIMSETEQVLKKPVAVEILNAGVFWPAEEYHQKYHQKNPARYKFYRWNCNRDQRVNEIWGK